MRKIMPLLLLFLASCTTVGPDYKRPSVDLPGKWSAPTGQTMPGGASWWSVYGDATLNKLMEEALANNHDLARAMGRVEEARALASGVEADRYPQVDATLSADRTQMTEVGGQPLQGGSPKSRSKRVSLNVSYELDLWGRYRRASEAARAELLAGEAARDTVRLVLTTRLAQGYFGLLSLDEQTATSKEVLHTRRSTLSLQRLRFEAGIISEMELHQAEAEVAQAEALLSTIEVGRTAQENALAVLLGRSPREIVEGKIERDTSDRDDAYEAPTVVPDGIPSDMLLRRPDLREAEQRLIAANARIGVARAAYFPSISLTGFLGSESAALTDLFTGPARIWQFAANVLQPIFGAGKLSSRLEAAEARQKQALEEYRGSIANAFREVQDAIVSQVMAREALGAETRRADALRKALALARLRYDSGVVSQLEVLDSERELLVSRMNRIDAIKAQRTAVADLVKAMGGGWEASPGTRPIP